MIAGTELKIVESHFKTFQFCIPVSHRFPVKQERHRQFLEFSSQLPLFLQAKHVQSNAYKNKRNDYDIPVYIYIIMKYKRVFHVYILLYKHARVFARLEKSVTKTLAARPIFFTFSILYFFYKIARRSKLTKSLTILLKKLMNLKMRCNNSQW